MTARRALVLLALIVSLAPPAHAEDPGTPAHAVTGVPDVIQMNSYSCGVGCVQAVAQRYGHWGYQEEWARELGTTPKNGTHPLRIIRCLTRLGLHPTLVERMTLADLQRHIDQGHVVIIDYQAWGKPGANYEKDWEDGHYSIAVGYNDRFLFIEDPSLLGTIGYLAHEDFVTRWHDYEIEHGKRREYLHLAIVITDTADPLPRFTPIE